MKTNIKRTLATLIAAASLGAITPTAMAAKAPAKGEKTAAPETFDRCGWSGSRVNISIGGRSGFHGNFTTAPVFRDSCRLIDTCYFTRGCYRYCKRTYLHTRLDSCGRVVRSWRTYKTVCLGRW